MPIVDTPTIEQNLGFTIGLVIPIIVRNKNQFRRFSDIDSTHSNSNT